MSRAGEASGRYRKKSSVNAFQWTGDWDALTAWLSRIGYDAEDDDPAMWVEEGNRLGIETLEGPIVYEVGYWVIEGTQGEFYACDPDVFQRSYEWLSESMRLTR